MSDYLKPDISGNIHTVNINALVEIKTDDYTVLPSDNGKYFGMGTAGKYFTLPPTENGLIFRFYNSGVATNNEVNVSPNAVDSILGKFTLAGTTVVMTGVDNKDAINTAATSERGDFIELTGNGTTGWVITGSAGIWKSE